MEDSSTISNHQTHPQQQPLSPSELEKEIGNHGLTKRIIRRGTTWQTPFPGDEVEVHYGGHVEDGASLGSSRETGASFKFKLGQGEVIKGLDEGVATMKKGERAIFKVPPTLAYGEVGFPPLVPPHSTLVFDVEMISWSTIRDITEDGGVLKKIIAEGEGWATPKDGDEVSVKYEAKLEDGTEVYKSECLEFHVGDGQLCPAIHRAVKTMRKSEKAELSVRFSYGFGEQRSEKAVTSSIRRFYNNNITIFLELLSWRRVMDILGDKKILKKVISPGEGFIYPNEGSLVKVIYVGKREDGTIFEQKGSNEEPFEYMCLEDHVDEDLDKAIMTMKKGEKALVFVFPDDVQGDDEVSESNFCNPKLQYEVELLDFTKEKPFWKMDSKEKIEACEKKKLEGNALFQAGKFWLASKKYEKAAKCVEFSHNFSEAEKGQAKALLVSCNLNNAACKLKLEDYVGAATLCTKIWLMDRLSLIAPPENMTNYNTKSFCTRRRQYTQKPEYDWSTMFAYERAEMRWVLPWWHIPRMVAVGSTPVVRISGLKTLTFYFPTRVLRQYGRPQRIPEDDTIRPADKPMSGENPRRWETYWMARPKLDVLDLDPEDCRISRHYITWMSSGDSARRAEARAAEKRYEGRKRTREDVRRFDEGPSRAPVKERLGSRKTAVWERLNVAKEKTREVKTNAKEKQKEVPRKTRFVWKRKQNVKEGGEEKKEKEKNDE